MLLLLLLLFKRLLCYGASTVAPLHLGFHHSASEEPLSYRFIQISSFANHSWAQTQSSGWLGEVQTEVWDSVLGTIRFLRPWSQGNFSKEELKNLQALLQLYMHGFTKQVQAFASQFQFEYPFELQILSSCQMHAGKASGSFLYGAYQGSDFLSFRGNSWKPSPGAGSQAQNVCRVLNHYRIVKEIVQNLLSDTCPGYLAGLVEAGKSDLERQVKPEAWVSKGPSPGSGHLLLVCHVSGFHPKPVWVMWMRDGYSILPILICLTVIITLVMLVVVDSWFKKQSPVFSIRANIQDPTSPGHQLCLTQELWIKNRFSKNWKTSLKQLW
ncbi:T-cell surface glycoprotein CD1e, membrane-associated-like isoform X1 [Diceros bicornis minor]|uniref:T-cell surface glycoprotein CD1e, membrane-associated-like isoform X1 n=1 Tax=Diceros bicornis minor TaxID=77932 RepID=UPI0026ED5D9E|nr:T-cell surface glycoprotein CD1e, membrane-associated-like isoform X1 [Diceros bicornis minor]